MSDQTPTERKFYAIKAELALSTLTDDEEPIETIIRVIGEKDRLAKELEQAQALIQKLKSALQWATSNLCNHHRTVVTMSHGPCPHCELAKIKTELEQAQGDLNELLAVARELGKRMGIFKHFYVDQKVASPVGWDHNDEVALAKLKELEEK